MFRLPIPRVDQGELPIQEYSALLLVTALLQEDLDDRFDGTRAAIEIDPCLALWSVITANTLGEQPLRSIDSASRWLARYAAELWDTESLTTLWLPARQVRDHVRATIRQCIAVARLARHLAAQGETTRGDTVLPSLAYWQGLVCSAARRITHPLTANGRPSFCDRAWSLGTAHFPHNALPCRFISEFGDHDDPDNCCAAVIAASRLVAEHPHETTAAWVSDDESDVWFRSYPEFQGLVPSLLQTLRRVGHLEDQFQQTLQREKIASLHQFAYGASHEINNPLANIATRAQTLIRGEENVDRRRKLQAINDQAFRAHEMIADLMLFADPPAIEWNELGWRGLLTNLVRDLETCTQGTGATIQVRMADGPGVVWGDKTQLTVAFKAICQNALDAIASDGTVQIELEHDLRTRQFLIHIVDNGPGLSDLARRHLFDPFFSGREAGRGLGFGLSKAWRIITQHGGTIRVMSEPPRGTTVTVALPDSRGTSGYEQAMSNSPDSFATKETEPDPKPAPLACPVKSEKESA